MKINLSYVWAGLIALAIVGWMFSDEFLNNKTDLENKENTSSESNSNKKNNLIISALKVQNTEINNEIISRGYTEPEIEITLSSEISGKVLSVLAKEGKNIKAGSKIIEIDPGNIEQQIVAAKRKIKASQANINATKKGLEISKKVLEGTLDQEIIAAKASLELAKKNLAISKDLAKNNFSSELEIVKNVSEVENAKVKLAIIENRQNYDSELDLARSISNLEQAKYDLAKASSDLAKLEKELKNSLIISPIAGKLEELFIDKGELITQNSPIANIISLNKVKLIVNIPQSEITEVEIGNNVLITIDNGNNYEGKVSKISSKANESTRTFSVEILIDNKTENLKGGMTAEAIIKTNLEKAFGISPAHLIVNDNGELFVKTVNDNNKVKMRKVVIVKSIQDKVFISGLNDGSIILTTGQAFADENDIINYKLEY